MRNESLFWSIFGTICQASAFLFIMPLLILAAPFILVMSLFDRKKEDK
jgi:fumarate reductase subunit D